MLQSNENNSYVNKREKEHENVFISTAKKFFPKTPSKEVGNNNIPNNYNSYSKDSNVLYNLNNFTKNNLFKKDESQIVNYDKDEKNQIDSNISGIEALRKKNTSIIVDNIIKNEINYDDSDIATDILFKDDLKNQSKKIRYNNQNSKDNIYCRQRSSLFF